LSVSLMACVLCRAALRPAVIDCGDAVGEEASASVHGDVFRRGGKTNRQAQHLTINNMHARACKQCIAVHRFSGNAEVEKSAARVHGGVVAAA
jgi:hypothetical protein